MEVVQLLAAAQRLVDAVDGDIFTDAPECAAAVTAVFYAAREVEIAVRAVEASHCVGCGRASEVCWLEPCPDVIADRED